jgi:hypothetical protein
MLGTFQILFGNRTAEKHNKPNFVTVQYHKEGNNKLAELMT